MMDQKKILLVGKIIPESIHLINDAENNISKPLTFKIFWGVCTLTILGGSRLWRSQHLPRLSRKSGYGPVNNQVKKTSRNKYKKTSIYQSSFKTFSFHSREYEFMAPVSKRPITFRWKQVIQYKTSGTGDSLEQIRVPILYNIIKLAFKKPAY